MKRSPLSERIQADLIFRERQPGDGGDPVQWQMPDGILRLFEREARRHHTDLNSLIRDFVCAALTERAAAINRITAELERQPGDE
jgi:hypothetical protein